MAEPDVRTELTNVIVDILEDMFPGASLGSRIRDARQLADALIASPHAAITTGTRTAVDDANQLPKTKRLLTAEVAIGNAAYDYAVELTTNPKTEYIGEELKRRLDNA